MEKCILCKKKLRETNKSGFCNSCYTKSPFYLEYQRKFQRRWYSNPENKQKKVDYNNKPKVKAKKKKYMREYCKEHIETLRIQKRDWARRNRGKK